MASNKKIDIPISSLSSDEIYALLDSIESDEEEDIENFLNDSDKEFVDRSVVENKDSDMHVDEEPETTSNDAHSNLVPTHLPIQAVVRQDVPEEESSDDEPLITLAIQKAPVWKWRMSMSFSEDEFWAFRKFTDSKSNGKSTIFRSIAKYSFC